jgi:mono/diheme cytochrome c family protein
MLWPLRFAIYLTVGLWNHGKAMAGVMEAIHAAPTFEKNDIADLLAYIRTTAGSVERVYLRPGNPQIGEKLFVQKRCAQCHTPNAQGTRVGPDLRTKLKGSLIGIAGAMWNHGPKMWAKMGDVPSLAPEEMSDLISYLYFLQFIDPSGNAARGEWFTKKNVAAAVTRYRERAEPWGRIWQTRKNCKLRWKS